MTDLNNIPFLLEVVDRGSFSAAARALGVPPSLVSRKIARLEADVGARLFQRTTRSMSLTDAGDAFVSHARSGMNSFSLAHELLGTLVETPTGRVRLSAPSGIGAQLWAAVSAFLMRYPGIRVEMELTDRYVDLVADRIDVAIRSGPVGRIENLVGRRLADAPRLLFAAPSYLNQRGTPRSVGDLSRHACVVLGPRSDRVTWKLQVGKRVQHVVVDGRLAVNEATLAATCAADGWGVAFLPLAVCKPHLETGALTAVLPRASGGSLALWLVYPDRHLAAASRALVQFLGTEPWLTSGRTSTR